MRQRLRDNGLSLVFGALLLVALVGQAFTGQASYNEQASDAGLPTVSLLEYVTSSHFTVDVAENWQSEYLQFLLFILLTIFLFQKGSTESKPLDRGGRESDRDQKVAEYAQAESPAWAKVRGWRLTLFSHSLGLTMGLVFVLSWVAQLVAGHAAHNSEQIQQRSDPLGWWDYLLAPDFWNRTLQNWQSEFLAVGSMVVLSIYLRERGSPESKPVGEPHESTGSEG
ncbi:hypothetical protein P0Y31_04260 [Knoellia sp. 3-2P3]|uniref:DUF6766 family protein n=1 Tax=unclassified Knoellia TaxID=2618719 RepID=UPI0023D9DBAC|nr:DUF6766 family protein [Knoellia sp. 3-2P3]MDF2091550.1 hypothetical protein [Knoellia sp. 3-2P3]